MYTPTPDQNSGLVDMTSYGNNTAQAESDLNANAVSPVPGSTASGLYGITDPTFQDIIAKHPELANSNKNDPAVLGALTGDNARVLTDGLGRIPSQLDLHAAHFLGATGAVKFLSADPNTPVSQVVSPEALAANHNVFYQKNGTENTVGQVYAAASKQFGGNPTMPPVDPQNGTMAQRNPGSYAVASSGNAVPPPPTNGTQNASTPAGPSPTGAFPSADSVYGGQSDAIQKYIAGQPAIQAQLAALAAQYKQASQPTTSDLIDDGLNKYAQASSAARANQLASAGGVLLHANPDASSFITAEQNAHLSDIQARQQAQQVAKTTYDIGSQNLQNQQAQNATNIGLTGQLAQQKGQYGFETQKATQDYNLAMGTRQLELAKFGNEQIVGLTSYAEKLIPNPETRAQVMATFATTGNPNAPLATNMKVLDGLVANAQANGMQISAKEPAKMMSISSYDPTANGGTGGQKLETVNAATPEGQARLKVVAATMPDAKVTDLGAPSTNVSVNTGEGGKSGPAPLAEQHLAAITTANNVDVASKLLDYLEQHGGTGTLTNSDASIGFQKNIAQVTGMDPLKNDARQLYNKVMSQIQTQQTLATMKGVGGRPSDNEFKTMQAGSLGSQATVGAARTYLQHAGALADWNRRSVENQNTQRMAALQSGNKFYDPDNEQIKWQSDPANAPPQWNVQDITTDKPAPASSGAAGTQPQSTSPTVGETRAIPGTNRVGVWDGTTWQPQ